MTSSLTPHELSWKISLRVGRERPSPSPGILSVPHLLQGISSSLAPSLPFSASPEGMGSGELLEFGVYFDLRASPIALLFQELSPSQGSSRDIFPCPSSSSLPQGTVLEPPPKRKMPPLPQVSQAQGGRCGTILAGHRGDFGRSIPCAPGGMRAVVSAAGIPGGICSRGMCPQCGNFTKKVGAGHWACGRGLNRAGIYWKNLWETGVGDAVLVTAPSHTSNGSCWQLF